MARISWVTVRCWRGCGCGCVSNLDLEFSKDQAPVFLCCGIHILRGSLSLLCLGFGFFCFTCLLLQKTSIENGSSFISNCSGQLHDPQDEVDHEISDAGYKGRTTYFLAWRTINSFRLLKTSWRFSALSAQTLEGSSGTMFLSTASCNLNR